MTSSLKRRACVVRVEDFSLFYLCLRWRLSCWREEEKHLFCSVVLMYIWIFMMCDGVLFVWRIIERFVCNEAQAKYSLKVLW